MRAYRLHEASWSRIVTHRMHKPEAILARLASRRRNEPAIPPDGQLVLLAANQQMDPRTGAPVGRRELLARLVEALSVPGVDGVVGSADIVEELTLLNVLDRRSVFLTASGDAVADARTGTSSNVGVVPSRLAECNVDGVMLTNRFMLDGSAHAVPPWTVANGVAWLAEQGLPSIVELSIVDSAGRTELETEWPSWLGPLHAATSTVTTGAGLWLSLPPIRGFLHLAEATGFPILIRDTDVPIDPAAWQAFFAADLPIMIRGLIVGASGLFPHKGTVAEATAAIATACRG